MAVIGTGNAPKALWPGLGKKPGKPKAVRATRKHQKRPENTGIAKNRQKPPKTAGNP